MFSHLSLQFRLIPLAALFLPLAPLPSPAQILPPQPQPVVEKVIGSNTYTMKWISVLNRSYYVQTSTDLVLWLSMPELQAGTGSSLTPLGYNFAPSTGGRLFLRLRYADSPTGQSGPDGDLDGDGISNSDELAFGPQTDPFVSDDKDGDGILDSDEIAAGTNPNLATSKPFDPTNPPPANRYVVPLSWWLENKFNTTLEALTALGDTFQISNRTAQATTLADGSYDLPYLSIQAAINSAAPGDLIEVAPGTYAESLDLSAREVKIMGRRTSRDETILTPPAAAAQGILLGAANTGLTVLSGFTIQGSTGAGVVSTGGGAKLHNLYLKSNKCGIAVSAGTPVLANVIVDSCTGTASTDAALRITGTAQVCAVHCTLADTATPGAQVQVVGSNAKLKLLNCLVTNSGPANRTGLHLSSTLPANLDVTYSSIRTGQTGVGNVVGGVPGFDETAIVGGQKRLLRTALEVDAAYPKGLAGCRYLTKLDADGESQRKGFGLAAGISGHDIGADAQVSRSALPLTTRKKRGQLFSTGRVDEASDVAVLGVLPNGNTKIAVINDETVKDFQDNEFNQITFLEIDRLTGAFVNPTYLKLNRYENTDVFGTVLSIPDRAQVKDPETIAYDPLLRRLYVSSSQTKVDRYRDCSSTDFDPLIDPPSNDYDPRRGIIVTVQLDLTNSNFIPVLNGTTYTDCKDGGALAEASPDRRDLLAFAQGITDVSASGYESPNGMVATLRAALATNPALQSSTTANTTKNAGVLIAINTKPKFGTPLNGVTYSAGQALPYDSNAQGGATSTAGYAVGVGDSAVTPNPNADSPYWVLPTPPAVNPAALPEVGRRIEAYRTSPGGP